MGGVLILIGLFSGILLWSDLNNPFNWFLIFIVASFGMLGAYDDIKKIKGKSSAGISSKTKNFYTNYFSFNWYFNFNIFSKT